MSSGDPKQDLTNAIQNGDLEQVELLIGVVNLNSPSTEHPFGSHPDARATTIVQRLAEKKTITTINVQT